MSEPSEMHARHRRQLAQIAEWGMELLGQMQADAMAGTKDERAELALKFHRVARGVRQCMALEARLEREQQRLACEAVQAARRDRAEAVERRQAHVRAAVTRLVWDEHEPGELLAPKRMLARLDRFLDEDGASPELLDEPIEAQIARLCRELGVDEARAFTTPPPDALSSA